ncbi:uncharacterized protein LOC116296564 [Actinia tenebrosa]|uniref:Uncharacterized protein LOC116296564 n=1 Tax=Actinia tenebrosa TaxID=6105 RepID=A0A6P8HYS7_ACTTE|nr:uncharacterized protein LOC116296564 [Actinia tenebrosa]
MKKAVTIVKSLLKFPKLRRKNDLQKTESEQECEAKPKLPEITIFRPCERCVLIYENSVWKYIHKKQAQEEYCHLEWCDKDEEEPSFEATDKTPSAGQIQGFFQHHGLVRKNQDIPVCIDKSCMNSACLRDHVIWECKSTHLNMPTHYPAFVFLVQSNEKWSTPVLYEDMDIILFRMNFSTLCSILNWNSVQECGAGINMEAWVVISKLYQRTVTLEVEENLVHEYLDYISLLIFLDVPSSKEARGVHLDNLFQAVDNIIDISLYITLTSGIPPENQSYLKDTIIETATVVTSTAAESTATVGIETAAMAMGQAAAGVALSVLVDVAITAGMVTRAKIRRDKGLISQKEFQKTVRDKLCDSGCQFIGGTTGTIVGQVLIPVPVVGAIVGGFCGSLIGAGVSKGIIKTSEIISKTQASKLKAITDKESKTDLDTR